MVANADPRRRDVGEILPPRAFWPAWRFHPDFTFKEDGTFDPKMGKIFQSPEAVPPGWTSTPGTPDPEHVPHPDTLELAKLKEELAAIKATGLAAAPSKKPTKKEVALRTSKESEAISYGYDAAEVTAASDEDLEAVLTEERAKLKAKTDGAN